MPVTFAPIAIVPSLEQQLAERARDLSLTIDAMMATPANAWSKETISYLRELCGQLSEYDIPAATRYYERLIRTISAVPRPVRSAR